MNTNTKERFIAGMCSFFVFSAHFLAGCVNTAHQFPLNSSLQTAELPPLIPTKLLFDDKKEKSIFRISPDGKKLAWVETVRGARTVHFKTLGENKVKHISINYGDINYFRWAQDSRRILVNYRLTGKENNSIYSFDSKDPHKRPFRLVEFEGFLTDKKRALIHQMLLDDPENIIVENNDRDLSCYDLYKVNIHKIKKELIAENPGDVRTWITDRKGSLRGRIRVDEISEDKVLEAWESDNGSWRKVTDMDFEDVFRILGFDDKTGDLWVLSNRKRDKIALVRFSLNTGKEVVVYEDNEFDVENYELCEETQEPFLLYLHPNYPRKHFLDPKMEKEFEPVLKKIREDGFKGFNITSADNKAQVFIIFAYSDKDWIYYMFNRISGGVEILSRNPQSEYALQFSDIKPISFTSRDGLLIHGYLTIPKGARPKNLPLVLLVHGGPWSRDYWGFNTKVQFFANRGYAVLQINFRGSSGYGRKFMEAAVGEFAGKMQTDLIDGVNWTIKEGIADANKIAICGSSYGGYAALVGLMFTPDFFACGIDVFGPSNLEALIEHAPIWWKLGMPKWRKYVGDPKNPADLAVMRAKSPLYKVEAIKKPLLVIYGSEDQRVAKKHSEDIIEKLTESGKEFEWYSFPDEGHGISGNNEITYYNLIQTFLAKNLGGRN